MTIPPNWRLGSIATVADVVGGGTPDSKDPRNFAPPGDGVPWVTPADLSGYRAMHIARGARDLSPAGFAACSARPMPIGAVLFSSRAPVGYVAIASIEGTTTNQGFKSFVFPSAIDPRFAYYQLRHLKPAAGAMATGTTFKELSGSAAARLPFAVAPTAEQQRIADKLDTVLTRVDACRDRLARVAPVLKRFRQSVLAAATAGQLTQDWRRHSATTAWVESSIEAVAEVGTGSTPLRSNASFFATSGTPWVTSGATSSAKVVEAEEFVTPAAIAAHRLKLYPPGTLLVAMYGEGKTRGQVAELAIATTINQACAAICIRKDLALPPYVQLVLQANYLAMRDLAEGGNQPNLNLTKIKQFAFKLPSIAEQAEIVRRVETLFSFADRIEARLAKASAAVDRLTPALLAKAFRGELVPQDPADEPAADLLRRLAESRTAAPAGKRRKPRST